MAKEQTISWIFMSIALASQNKYANLNEIKDVADYINRSIPSQIQLDLSIDWLIKKQLISQLDSKYQLTNLGKLEYNEASQLNKAILKIMENIETRIIELNEIDL